MVFVNSKCGEHASGGMVPPSLSMLLAGCRYAFWTLGGTHCNRTPTCQYGFLGASLGPGKGEAPFLPNKCRVKFFLPQLPLFQAITFLSLTLEGASQRTPCKTPVQIRPQSRQQLAGARQVAGLELGAYHFEQG